MKRCSKCLIEQPLDCFYRAQNRKDGLRVWCKSCGSAASAALHRRQPDAKYWQHLRLRYGLTRARYEALLAGQGEVCAICGGVDPDGRRLSVDHDHACCPGKSSCGSCVRGLLCTSCNVHIHWVENRPWRDRAERYLGLRP